MNLYTDFQMSNVMKKPQMFCLSDTVKNAT